MDKDINLTNKNEEKIIVKPFKIGVDKNKIQEQTEIFKQVLNRY